MKKIKIVTYNIRCLYDKIDGKNTFVNRADLILNKIDSEMPDIICFQELSEQIYSFLRKNLKNYEIVGHGRNSDYTGEAVGIAYKRDCMELFSLDQFWLSPTPYTPGSRYNCQSEYPRICTSALIKHKNIKTPIRFYNIHLDHKSDDAKILGISQVLNKVYQDNQNINYPTFILGDFNSVPESQTLSKCKEYTNYSIVDITKGLGETFHNFGGTGNTPNAQGLKIDYIFADINTAKSVKNVYKWTDTIDGIYLSDHYPICCEVEF
ncbi:MAG: endonuclease/exonuclease/phosphatase family protein [Clostridia bacterium]|nr:endonuclease/exonuclease/phosphatase family protein [Clostridia bacterium]